MSQIPEVADLKKRTSKGKTSPFVVLAPLDTGVLTEIETVLKQHLALTSPKVHVDRISLRTGLSRQAMTRQVDEVCSRVQAAAMQTGLFSEANLFVIQHFPADCCVTQAKALADAANDTNAILLALDQARGAKALLEWSRKNAFVVTLRNVARRQAHSVVAAAASQHGLSLTYDAIDTIIDLTGTDRGYLTQAVEALAAAYGTKRKITPEDCARMVSRRQKTMPWDLTDAVGRRDLGAALKAMNLLLEDTGQDVFRVFSTLMGHVRKLLSAQAFLMSDDPAGELARKLKMSPFPAKKHVEQTRNFTVEELTAFLAQGPDMEKTIKSASARAVPALTLFLTRLVVKSRR